jgi:fucose permease
MTNQPRRDEVGVVYLAGLVQGVALVTFPAAATVLTDPGDYGLSSSAYGFMFLPQAVTAVIGSLMGGSLSRRTGPKPVLVAGLTLDLAAMVLLVTSQVGMGEPLGYAMLLLATASLGLGFGLTVPTLNTYASAFYPARVDRAVLILNALLGLGTALAPVLAAIFLGLGAWWGLPALVAVGLTVLLVAGARLPLDFDASEERPPSNGARSPRSLPAGAWLFIAFALLYGIVETVNGNWATVYMGSELQASASAATLALAAFWGMVTIGRLLFAALERQVPPATTYRLLPYVAAIALIVVAFLPPGDIGMAILAFGLAGLGCSALLPLTISFGERHLVALGAATAGIIFASYQVGYGVAAFGVGPLEDLGLGLSAIYLIGAGVAVVLGLLALRLVSPARSAEAQGA